MPHDGHSPVSEGGSATPAASERKQPDRSIELIIFDCDGVLIDSEIIVCRLTSEEFTRLGFPVSTQHVIERFAGRPEHEMIEEVEAEWGQAVPPEFFTSLKRRVEEAYATELQIMPGIAELLEGLRADFCVASSSYPTKLRLGLETVGLYKRFAPNVVSASYIAHGKPAPDIFIYAAGWMQTTVTKCLVIEDSIPGVRAAVAAGMRVFGYTGGTHCPPGHEKRLLEAGAERVFGDFAAMDGVLQGIISG